MKKFKLDKQSLKFQVFYSELELSVNNQLVHNMTGIKIIPKKFEIEPLKLKENLIHRPTDKSDVTTDLYKGIYYTNIIDYTLGEITFIANQHAEERIEILWKYIIDEKENCVTVSLTDETITEHLIIANPDLFSNNSDVITFCEKYGLKLDDFVQDGKFDQLYIELEAIAARYSSEIIFFRKKLFIELFIQKIDAKIYEFEEVKSIIIPKHNKDIYAQWRTEQLNEIAIIQKYIKSPFTFDDVEQYTNFKSINDFSINSHDQQDLISETFYWIDKFPKAKKRFEIAVNYYKSKSDLRDSVDNLRLALEITIKELLKNDKSLENQISGISAYQESLGIGKEIRNTFQKTLEYFSKYQNNNVKHDDNVTNIHEVEFIFGLTMIFIRMLIKSNPDFQLK